MNVQIQVCLCRLAHRLMRTYAWIMFAAIRQRTREVFPSAEIQWAVGGSLVVLLGCTILGRTDPTLPTPQNHTVPKPAEITPVKLEYFFEKGCLDCLRVETEVLPALAAAYAGFYDFIPYDLGIHSNYLKLAHYMETLNITANAHVYVILDGLVVLAGPDEIAKRLLPVVEARIQERLRHPSPPPPPVSWPPSAPPDLLSKRLARFTLGGVVLGGLLDGINPCALSTLVFLISVLTLVRARRRHLLLIGAFFCAGSFLTYSAIGFGLLRALHALAYFRVLQKAVDIGLVGVLLVLATVSFRDAWRYAQTHSSSAITLQLPDNLKQFIHRLLRTRLGGRAQLTSAFAIGMAVTALESVCTGQVYVPTLTLVVRSGTTSLRAIAYLTLYNVMFVLPLIIVFICTYQGLKLAKLMAWSARNVAVAKVLLGFFFLSLAGLLLWLK